MVATKVTRLAWFNDHATGTVFLATVPAGQVWRVRGIAISAGPPGAVTVATGVMMPGNPPAVEAVHLGQVTGTWWASLVGDWDLQAGDRIYLDSSGLIFRGCVWSGWKLPA